MFGLRVSLLGRETCGGLFLWESRPGGHVLPVLEPGEQHTGIQEGLVPCIVHRGDILAVGGIIHHAGRLGGGGVEPSHFRLYHLAEQAGNRFVLIGGYILRERDHYPQAGGIWAVLGGGVNAVAAPQGLHPPHHAVRLSRPQGVRIQHSGTPGEHGPGLSPAAAQLPQDKAAHILQIVLLALRQGHVAIMAERDRLGAAQPLKELPDILGR